MNIEQSIIKQMPKTDLHCHLDGSVRIETILDLAKKQNVELPASNYNSLKKILVPGLKCKSLVEYLIPFDITLSVLQEADALYRAAYELAEDAAMENIWYLEVRYSPVLHTKKDLKLTEVVDAVVAGLKEAEKKFHIKTGVIICGMRNINPETSVMLAELAMAYKNRGVVAFDLAGAEENYPAKHHREAFYIILNHNINCTAHAGEAFGPESIHQAIHYCGAHRIGHGTRLKEDIDLLNYVNDHRIPLEVCLTSNIQTKAATSYASHPLKFYYDYGLRVTINTDNRTISNTTITKELHLAARYAEWSLRDLKNVIVAGFKSAFLPMREKAILLNMVNAELEKF
ncbi:MAG: adenosine deaminase [Calditrichaceae bacterium]|nr:adenosine deaminase [Calditrichaceae bacterium]MBN2709133.1 adenosine deaminase [Calditrichaceae bacterium]RQV96089.1 MAG: adenosine deaminase [Calditrichota bacterium]